MADVQNFAKTRRVDGEPDERVLVSSRVRGRGQVPGMRQDDGVPLGGRGWMEEEEEEQVESEDQIAQRDQLKVPVMVSVMEPVTVPVTVPGANPSSRLRFLHQASHQRQRPPRSPAADTDRPATTSNLQPPPSTASATRYQHRLTHCIASPKTTTASMELSWWSDSEVINCPVWVSVCHGIPLGHRKPHDLTSRSKRPWRGAEELTDCKRHAGLLL